MKFILRMIKLLNKTKPLMKPKVLKLDKDSVIRKKKITRENILKMNKKQLFLIADEDLRWSVFNMVSKEIIIEMFLQYLKK